MVVTREGAAEYHGFKDIPLFPFHEQRTRLYECVIDQTKVHPRYILCIGDTPGELMPANRLQMTTVGVLTGMGGKEDLENCSQFTIQNLNQVKEILEV